MLFFKTAKITLQGFWEKITASDLGTGSTGTGNKYLADDMTWKTLIGGTSVDDIRLNLKLSQLEGFKEFLYTGDNLTQLNIYEDNTLTIKLFQVDYTYTGDDLTLITVERIMDSYVYTKTLSYDVNGNLESIEII